MPETVKAVVPVRLEALEVIPYSLRFREPYVTARGRLTERQLLLVRLRADGVEGLGETAALTLRGGSPLAKVARDPRRRRAGGRGASGGRGAGPDPPRRQRRLGRGAGRRAPARAGAAHDRAGRGTRRRAAADGAPRRANADPARRRRERCERER